MKLLIAEDESMVANAILEMPEWKANGIEVCGIAPDGRQALQMLDEHHPDLMLLDIRMPELSGLEVLAVIKRSGRDMKCLILSGYGDFEYAREALKNGAADYLLKPCHKEELLRSVFKARDDLTEERFRKRDIALDTESSGRRHLHALLAGVCSGDLSPDNPSFVNHAWIASLTPPIQVAVLSFDMPAIHEKKTPATTPEKQLILRLLSDRLPNDKNVEVLSLYDDWVFLFDSSLAQSTAIQELVQFRELLSQQTGRTLSISLGAPIASASDLHAAWKQACSVLQGRFFSGPGSLLFPAEGQPDRTPVYPNEQEACILRAIREGQESSLPRLLSDFFDRYALGMPGLAMDASLSLFLAIERLGDALLLGKLQQQMPAGWTLSVLSHCIWASELINHLLHAARLLTRAQVVRMGTRVVDQACAFMESRYMDNLDLETVSRKVHLTPAYFSQLFKQETGINFTDHLQTVRMRHACHLLETSQEKTQEIARKVGYGDRDYFTLVFKRHTGMTPAQYRKASLFLHPESER